MARLITVLCAAVAVASAAVLAYAQTGTPESKTTLSTEINTNFPNNTSGKITPQLLRQTTQDMTSSWVDWVLCSAGGTTHGVPLWNGTTYVCASLSGDQSKVASVSGALTSGNCINADGNGNLVAGSGACVSSGSGVTAGSTNNAAYYASNGSVVSGRTLTSFFDTVFCNTIGYIVARTTSAWVCSNNIPANVVWFGADPTGVSDSTTAISNTINAASFNFGPNVYFPCGVYISSGLTVTLQNKKLMGDSAGCASLKWKANSSGDFLTMGDGSGDFFEMSIENMTIDGNGSNQSAGNNDCLRVQNIRAVHVTNVDVTNCFKTGVLIKDNPARQDNASGMIMVNSTVGSWGVGGTGNGVDIETNAEVVIISNSWINSGPTGTDSAHAAIFSNSPVNPPVIANNNIFTDAPHIYVSGGSGTITGNQQSYLSTSSQCLILSGTIGVQYTGNYCIMSVGDTKLPVSLINTARGNIFCGNIINANGAVSVAAAFTEDSTSKPNTYCGPNPAMGNAINQFSGSFTQPYAINGPVTAIGASTVTLGSTDQAGSYLSTAGQLSSAMQFASAWKTTPTCTLNGIGTPVIALSAIYTTSVVASISAASAAATITYACAGNH